MSSARHWVFTLNNPSDDEYAALLEVGEGVSSDTGSTSSAVSYLVFGRERGERGTMHFQGFISFVKKVRIRRVKETVSSRIHAEVARGTPRSKYVSMQPGEIRKSVLSSSATKSLQGWVRFITTHIVKLRDSTGVFHGPSTVDASFDNFIQRNINFACSRMFGLEQMCDTTTPSTGNHIEIGAENIINMSAKAWRKHKPSMQVTTTLVTV